jgi:hypothetical protein
MNLSLNEKWPRYRVPVLSQVSSDVPTATSNAKMATQWFSPHDGDGELHIAFAIGADDLASWEAWLAGNGIAVEENP